MNQSQIAKWIAWGGGIIALLGSLHLLGPHSLEIAAAIPMITASAVHIASNTSAGHPDGIGTTQAVVEAQLNAAPISKP